MNYLKSDIIAANTPLDLAKVASDTLDPYLKFYSLIRLENLGEFVTSFDNYKFFSVRGVEGSGKSSFKTLVKNLIDNNILFFDYNCSDITELDDIFLKFYKFILKHPIKGDILRKKTISKSQSIDEQILYYLKNSSGNIVLIFDNFEKLLDENCEFRAQNVKSFFEFLSSLNDIKVVIFTSVKLESVLELPDNIHFSTRLEAIEEDKIKDFFSIFKIDIPNSLLSQVYDLTSGHIFSLKFLAMATKILNLPVSELIKDCTLKRQELNIYIAKKLISKLSQDAKKVLYYAVFFRHDITLNILKSIDYFEDVSRDVELLKNYMLLDDENDFEIRDFLRKMLYDTFPTKEKMKLHEKIADFYGEQLPLKPNERVLEISRTSMYSEKFYHYNVYSKLSKSVELQTNGAADSKFKADKISSADRFKYMASTKYFPDFEIKTADDEKTNNDAVSIDIDEQDLNLSDDEKALLNDISVDNGSLDEKNNTDFLFENDSQEQPVEEDFSFDENFAEDFSEVADIDFDDKIKAENFINKANDALQNDNFNDAITYFKNAMALLQDLDNSAYKQTKLTMIRVLIDSFKYDDAFRYLNEMYDDSDVSQFQVDVLIELGSVSEYKNDSNTALDYYSKALNCASELDLPALTSKAYFKMALLFDDANDINNALEYYLLAVDDALCAENSIILASAYSNIASIFEEKGDYFNALSYYKKSLKEDEFNKNHEGLAKTYSAIGNIFLKKNEYKVAIKSFIKETQVAKLTADCYLVASAFLELGDTFLSIQDYKNALKAYLLAKKNIDATISTDSKNKIERRFDTIVEEIGESAYRFLLKELGK